MTPTKLNVLCFVVRHGQTVLNAEKKFRGNKNPVLDATGRDDAHTLAEIFKDVDLSHIICSDKVRATETAEIIGKEQQLPVHKTENLRALNVGNFSGLERNKENTDSLQKFLDSPDECIPGGESLNDFKSRINPCLNEAVSLGQESGAPVLVVAHSSIVHQLGDLLYGDHHKILVDPGGIVAIYLSENGKVEATPIFKKSRQQPDGRADTVS